MGKRGRQRERADRAGGFRATDPEPAVAPSVYADPEAGELRLRGVLTLGSRRRYAETLHGGLNREDALQRAAELLFEQLAVSWTVNGVATDTPKALLARYRIASGPERAFVRDALRRHATEHFPDVEAP